VPQLALVSMSVAVRGPHACLSARSECILQCCRPSPRHSKADWQPVFPVSSKWRVAPRPAVAAAMLGSVLACLSRCHTEVQAAISPRPNCCACTPHAPSAPSRLDPGSCRDQGPPDSAPAPAEMAEQRSSSRMTRAVESLPELHSGWNTGGGLGGSHLRHIASVGVVHDCPHARDRLCPFCRYASPLNSGCACAASSAEQ